MSMFAAAGNGISSISLSATWEDINTSLATPATNSNRTLTYAGSTRQILVGHALAGTLQYRVNSGSYTNCPNGTTFNVPSGQTLNFRFNADTGGDNNVTVTVRDNTKGETLDTFTCNDFTP